MNNGFAANTNNQVPLIRLLTQFNGQTPTEPGIAEQLGRMINLADAIHFADSLYRSSKAQPEPSPIAAAAAQKLLLQERSAVIRSLKKAKWPTPPQPFEIYFKFYVAQQTNMERRIAKLREDIRQAIAEQSQTLAHLAALDRTLDELFQPQFRKFFHTVPRLLQQRFSHWEQTTAGHEITAETLQSTRFGAELMQVFLAELDLRLKPILGLLEALDANHPSPQIQEANILED